MFKEISYWKRKRTYRATTLFFQLSVVIFLIKRSLNGEELTRSWQRLYAALGTWLPTVPAAGTTS